MHFSPKPKNYLTKVSDNQKINLPCKVDFSAQYDTFGQILDKTKLQDDYDHMIVKLVKTNIKFCPICPHRLKYNYAGTTQNQ